MLGLQLGLQLDSGLASDGVAPVNVSPPTLSSVPSALVGVELTVGSGGTWTGSPTLYYYQWVNTNGDIPYATSNAYTIQSSDVGLDIWCRVVAVNAYGPSLPAYSDSITALPTYLTNLVAPVATDDNAGMAPANLSTTDGSWDSNPPIESYSYQWYLNLAMIPSANSNTYAASDPGDYFCEVIPSNGQTTGSAQTNTVTLN